MIRFDISCLNPKNYALTHIISSQGKMIRCEPPKMTDEIVCPNCGSSEYGMTCLHDPAQSGDVMWFCSLPECIALNLQSQGKPPEKKKRAQEWIDVCKRFNIGDKNYGIRFEDLKRSQDTIRNMRNFAQKPGSTGLFMGHKGSGKTWSCLAILELFTRFSVDCHFTTAQTLQDQWLESEHKNVFKYRLIEVTLLIIDDFGQSPPADGFMTFIFDIVNNRDQWSNRGTIFTTNADPDLLLKYCGAALTDRLLHGEFNFEFEEENKQSRRGKR